MAPDTSCGCATCEWLTLQSSLVAVCANTVMNHACQRLFAKRFGPFSVFPVCPVCLSVTLVYCGQTVGWIKVKLGTEVGLGPGHIVLDVDPAPKKGHGPQFLAHLCCDQTLGWMMPFGTQGLGSGDIVLDGTPLPQKEEGTAPQPILAHVYCGQTAGWIKLPFGTQVGLGLGQATLCKMGTELPHPKKGHYPQFLAYVSCGQAAEWINMSLAMEDGLGPCHIVLDRGPPRPLAKGA